MEFGHKQVKKTEAGKTTQTKQQPAMGKGWPGRVREKEVAHIEEGDLTDWNSLGSF